MKKSTYQWALRYRKRGWSVTPLTWRTKDAYRKKWPTEVLSKTELREIFSGQVNIGIVLGKQSGWLADVDLDCLEARQLAPKILPVTGAVFGRSSSKESHRLYISPEILGKQFTGTEGKMIVEIRATGNQTMAPPSIHPSGQMVSWHCQGAPQRCDSVSLTRAVAILATCALIVQHWPKKGSRQKAMLALAGLLLSMGINENELKDLIPRFCLAARDEEVEKRIRAVTDTAGNFKKGEKVTAGPKLAELLRGDGKKVVEKIEGWLDPARRQRVSTNSSNYRYEQSNGRAKVVLISSQKIVNHPEHNHTKWLVNGLIPRSALVVLVGSPGSYKTFFALAISNSVARGQDFIGRRVTKGRVAYIDKENPRVVLQERLELIGSSKNLHISPNWQNPAPPMLDNGDYSSLASRYQLIVYDSLRRFHTNNENAPQEMAPLMENLRNLTKDGSTVLFLHHPAKSEGSTYRGSTEILAAVDVAFLLEKKVSSDRNGGPVPLQLRCIKNRFTEEKNLQIEFGKNGNRLTFQDVTQQKELEREMSQRRQIKTVQTMISNLNNPNQTILVKRMRNKLTIGKNIALNLLTTGEGRYWEKKKKGGVAVYSSLSSLPVPTSRGKGGKTK